MRTPSAILDEKFEQLFVPHMITNVVEEPFALLSELLEVLPDKEVLATEKAVVTAIFSTLKRNLSSWVGTEGLTRFHAAKAQLLFPGEILKRTTLGANRLTFNTVEAIATR